MSDTNRNLDSPDRQFSTDDARTDLQARRGPAAGSPGVQREGLPETYRMRADTHYVDHLTSRATVPLIRLIPTHSIDSVSEPLGHIELDPLIRSVRLHGVLQALLVRKNDARYTVIAGRKRLAAAQFAGLAAVPCVVHQVSEAEAEALAEADNLRPVPASTSQQQTTVSEVADDLRRQLRTHLTTVQTAATLLGSGEPIAAHVGLDLVHAHSTRASWLLEATELLTKGAVRYRHPRVLASVVEEVLDAVEPESRLVGANIRASFADSVASISLESNVVSVGVTGAIIAVLALLDHGDSPTITVTAARPNTGGTTLEIVGTRIVLPEITRFFDPTWADRPGGWSAVIGAWAARTAAEQQGGNAAFRVDAGGRGCVKLLMPKLQPSVQSESTSRL